MIDFPGVDQVLALASAELDAVELLAVERKPAAEIRRTAGHQHPQHFSPHWRGWLKPENRCLVPANGFSEYAPEPNPETKKKDVFWFSLSEDRPVFAFAGIWTEFKGDRG